MTQGDSHRLPDRVNVVIELRETRAHYWRIYLRESDVPTYRELTSTEFRSVTRAQSYAASRFKRYKKANLVFQEVPIRRWREE